jgi:hypothetical protein
MKKLMFSVLTMLFLGVATLSVNAQVGDTTQRQQTQDDMIEVTKDELPEPVQTALAGNDYRGWTVMKAYHNKKKDKFRVELSDGTQSKVYFFDKDGNVVENPDDGKGKG